MKLFRPLLIALALCAGVSLLGQPVPPSGAPNPIGDIAPIGYQANTTSWKYLQFDSTGALIVTGGGGGGGGGTSSNFAAAFPTAGTALGVKDSTGVNMTFLKADLSNALVIDNSFISGTAMSVNAGLPDAGTQRVAPAQQGYWRTTFAKTVAANGVDTTNWTLVQTGGGMAISQGSGNLVITTGTTANSETAIRSTTSWTGSFNLRVASQLSQRIANNNFYVELVDVVGDTLAYTITNATTVVVTVPGTTWTTAGNVGQTVYIGFITGAAGIPMKATIVSVSGTAVTLTVAGWPASGSGNCSLFGWNYHHVLYTSTTATNANYDAQGAGWPTGDTVATINTTAAPGHMAQIFNDDGSAYFSDSLVASTLTPAVVVRASRFNNLPPPATNLVLQIRALNGTSAPATTTTWTVFFVGLENFSAAPVNLQTAKLNGAAAPNVNIQNTPNIGTVTTVTGVTTVTTLSTLTTLANGQTAHSAASTGSPVRVAGRVVTAPDITLATGDASDLLVTTGQQLVVKDYATSENDWQATSGVTPLATTTSTALKAAGGASIRNFVTGLQIYNTSATVSTTVSILDGATVIWTGFLPATTAALPVVPLHVVFPTPLRGSAATAMNIQLGTTAASVYYNAEGYQSF